MKLSATGHTGLSPNSQARLKGKGKMLGLISLTAPPLNPIIHWVLARLPNRKPFLFSGYKSASDDRVTIFLSRKCSALVLTKHPA